MHLKRKLAQLFICVLFITSCSQPENTRKSKNLMDMHFGELFQLTQNTKDSLKKDFYARHLVKMGKRDKDAYATSVGYHFLANNRHLQEESLVYADSIILTMKSGSEGIFPSIAYQIKGDYYFGQRIYRKALENYLSVVFFAKKEKYSKMVFRFNLDIGDLKRLVGEPNNALTYYRENFRYMEKYPDSVTNFQYLYTLAGISNVYNDKKKVDSATFYNKYGFKEASRLDSGIFRANFALNQGITAYHEKNFQVAIDSFEKYIPHFKKYKNSNKRLPNKLSLSLFYCGKSYLEINDEEKAITYFKSVDSVFIKEQNLFPVLRETYKYLNKYYENKEEWKIQLTYLRRLNKVDSILHADKLYLSKKIIKEYEVPTLKAEKEEALIKNRKQSNTLTLLSVLSVLLLVGFWIQYRKRQIYKKRFQDILNKKPLEANKDSTVNKRNISTIDLPDKVIQDILKGLESFEKKQGFVSNKITLITLAKKLKTNPNYLSKVINYYKKCSFTNYLNSLRVEYAIEQLKTNYTYRKYTIKAIAEEVGFNNVQAFAKAFQKNKGINPSYFLKELNKVA